MVGNPVRGTLRMLLATMLAASMMILPGGFASEEDGQTGTVDYVGSSPTLIPAGSVEFLTGTNESGPMRTIAVLTVRDALDAGGPVGWKVGGAYCQVEAGNSSCIPGVDDAPAHAFCEGLTLTPEIFDPAMDTYVHVGAPFDKLAGLVGGRECGGAPKAATTGVVTFWPAA